MENITIKEILSNQLEIYKTFFLNGLVNDADSFRITPIDDAQSGFPTKGTADSFTLGAYLNNELAGIVSFAREGADREKLRHKGLLFRMYVAAPFRKKGLGKLLVAEVISRVKLIDDIEQINLTVIAGNDKAKALYESFGFNTFSSEEHAIKWNGRYFTEEQMVLRLK